MKNYNFLLIPFLIGITIFSAFQYVSSLKEKYDLQNSLNQIKKQVADLELARQSLLQEVEQEKELQKALTQENSNLKGSLEVNNEKLTKLGAVFQDASRTIEDLNSRISILKAENAALAEKKEKLALELTAVSQENEALNSRLSSVRELKRAIKELKKKASKGAEEIKAIAKTRNVIEGNRGFLIKDGKPTYPAKVKIEVTPASITE